MMNFCFSALKNSEQKELNEAAKNNKVTFIERECNCNIHGKYIAKVFMLGGYEIGYECPKCREKREAEENEAREKRERESFIRYCKECNVEPEYYYKDFNDYIPQTPSQVKAKQAVMDCIEKRHGKVVLLGGNGVGKTMLASITAKKLHGRVYSMYELSNMIRGAYSGNSEESEYDITSKLASLPFLAIDELGRTKGSDAEKNWLSYIIDKRSVRNLPTFILTNGHFKADCKFNGCDKCFENMVNNDILSRLKEDTVFVKITAPDARNKGE